MADPLRNLVCRPAKIRAEQPVLLIGLPFTIVGGAERLLSRVAGHLADYGWHVLITTSIDPGPEHGDMTHWFESTTREIYHLPRFLAPEVAGVRALSSSVARGERAVDRRQHIHVPASAHTTS